jgi:hypothetical protein
MKQDLSKLLALKKLETPGKAYFDHFPAEFQKYQRSELLESKKSWMELFLMPMPKLAWAAAFVALVSVGFMTLPFGGKGSVKSVALNSSAPVQNPDAMSVSLNYDNQILQQPELVRGLDKEVATVTAPRYVTGVTATSYDTSVTF